MCALTSSLYALPFPDFGESTKSANSGLTVPSKPDVAFQYFAPLHLAAISQPRPLEAAPRDWLTTYQYDSSAGKETIVYVVDSGVSFETLELQKMKKRIRVIGPKTWPPGWGPEATDHVGHGTCVTSIIGSEKYGVAKDSLIVMVKTAGLDRPDKPEYIENFLEALQVARDDIRRHIGKVPWIKGSIHLNLSIGIYWEFVEYIWSSDQRRRFKSLMQDLTEYAIVYCAAGNRDTLDYPQLWKDEIDGMILVGAADSRGFKKRPFANATPDGSLWAVGASVPCAGITKQRPEIMLHGSSMATPMAVGLGALIDALPGRLPLLPNPGRNFKLYKEKLFEQMLRDSWIRPQTKKWKLPNETPVPIISNRFLNHKAMNQTRLRQNGAPIIGTVS